MYVLEHKCRGSDFKNPGDKLCRWVRKVYRILRMLFLDRQTYKEQWLEVWIEQVQGDVVSKEEG
jgi:hypothetical protein